MHFFYAPDIHSGQKIYHLSETEFHHAAHVLRLTINDAVALLDGKGNIFQGRLIKVKKNVCEIEILNQISKAKPNYNIHIAIAPPKSGDKFDFFLEKAGEAGVDEISLLLCQNSERRKIKIDKEKKVLISAIKQSANPFLPGLNEMINFNTFINSCKTFEGQKFLCHCRNTEKTLLSKAYNARSSVLICIGPEGDFITEEIDHALSNNFMPVSLGDFRFRTETAGINAFMVINTINQISE